MRFNFLLLLLLATCVPTLLKAQIGQGNRATVMVVPWAKNLSDIKPLLDESFDYAAAINEIARAFDEEGFTTINFVEKYRNANLKDIINLDEWETEFKKAVEDIPADIMVQVRLELVPGKYGTSVNAIIEAVDKSSQESIRNSGVLQSKQRNSVNYAAMISELIRNPEGEFPAFMNGLDSKFQAMHRDGKSVNISIGIDENCPFDLEEFVGDEGDLLGEKIIQWFKAKSTEWYNDGLISDVSYRLANSDASAINYDNVKVPFATKEGTRYDVNEFGTEIRKAIAVMGKSSDKGSFFRVRIEVNRNQIYITILE